MISDVDVDDIKNEMNEIGCLKVTADTITKIPDNAIVLASGQSSHTEMWTKQDRVLCMMSSPDYNQTFIKELIINKLYEVG